MTRRSEFVPFVLDLVDFIEEKIQEALAGEGSRAVAISEAAGVVPLLRDRLREDEPKQAQFMLVFENISTGRMRRSAGLSSPGWIALPSRRKRPA
jgi:hypothetical protein